MRRSAVDSLMNYESKAQYEDSNYLRLLQTEFYDQHICRLQPWPEPVTRSFGHINYPIYLMMQGPSEFSVGGRLLNWDRWNDLKQIYIPTLMVGAKFDTMDPEDMKKQSEMVQHGRYLYCPNGSHLAMWDDQQVFMNGVIQFIKDVDGGGFKK
jgi:proline iminopeptidase